MATLRLMVGLASRGTCRESTWDPIRRPTGIPVAPRGDFRGRWEIPRDPTARHGISWDPEGLLSGSRGNDWQYTRYPSGPSGITWVPVESRGLPRESVGSSVGARPKT